METMETTYRGYKIRKEGRFHRVWAMTAEAKDRFERESGVRLSYSGRSWHCCDVSDVDLLDIKAEIDRIL